MVGDLELARVHFCSSAESVAGFRAKRHLQL